MHVFNSTLLLLAAVLISACASVEPVSNARPAWIDHPGNGVSVSAGMHVGGRVAQEELAILRGRTEFAKRMGVNIQSEQVTLTSVANDKSSTVGTQITHEDTSHSGIKVMVKEKWRDHDADVLWIWMVPSDK
ncbi:MAG: hypothetical protein B7Y56_13950 [Gallionellales bacterium 35-53-114]|jgi:hypothetical protein|nr:MAG: hypothetical protein B7Y56_13950 [Gallionellales bacterium 35-53-114]OYZ62971.1 MAG: hypothetical protein B7Y04_10865 [Gallionellales bacterium 24-53-125]OZB09047.1 MAG: hypothetical protein B7X61_08735 [Gallionellales bacterium 39-52-133]HQS59267.1 hypothetical protein [Gallionellaceae bacterium]HQS76180.1 hypothetical protein [Gallionellaceae bacterium]